MKAVYLGTDVQDFKNNMLNALLEFYGDIDHRSFTNSVEMKIPFGDSDLWMAFRYGNTILAIGPDGEAEVTNDDKTTFEKDNFNTLFTLLILKNNSITLLEGDSSLTNGGSSLYSIVDTDKGLIFFSYSERPSNIKKSKSICIETGKDLTPILFGNQYVSKDNEVLKQPLKFTDTDGIIYTCKDIYNISYKPEDFTALPKSFISNVGGSSKTHPDEKFNTSILIYDEED